MSNGYEFTITNGQVTGASLVFDDHTRTLRIPDAASFSVGTGSVTETLTGKYATEILQFTSTDGTLYQLASAQTVVDSPTTIYGDATFGYQFSISNGAVTAVQLSDTHGSHTSSRTLDIGPTTTFSVGTDGSVTATSVYGDTVESTVFVASGTAGLYAVQSDTETFIQQGTANTRLDVQPYDRAEFTIDGSGAVTAVQRVQHDGSTQAVTVGSDTSYSQLAAGYVLEVRTHDGHTGYEVYHDGNGDGIYTEVAHGSGNTVDLVGLQAQVTAAVNAVV